MRPLRRLADHAREYGTDRPWLSVDDIVQRRPPVGSRTGESLFWLGRYTERTEQLMRLARATLVVANANANANADTEAPAPLLQALSELGVRTRLERRVPLGDTGAQSGEARRSRVRWAP